ncbi:MAG: peptidyl-prolyl cis-trans isomerase [Burkholderiaceae bacterium]|nr:peptidyl-prolyl cis-trans isomerase [Burkholderiaceae bacterium]
MAEAGARGALPATRGAPPMRGLWREPLLHFVLIGAVLFGLYALVPGGQSSTPAAREIRLSVAEIDQLIVLYQAQWKRPPTPQELRQLVENKVQQEVLYREALAMGLDKDDEIVKRRMAQKMQFLAEDVAAAREPSRDELQRWFDAHPALFAQPPRLGFRHLYFSPDRRGARAKDDAQSALARLAGQPEDAALATTLADPFMFQDYYRDRSPEFLAKEFGPGFAHAASTLTPGAWQGPVESGFGWHLVYIDTAIPGRVPSFDEVEPEVKRAWLAEQKAQASQKAYQAMRERYSVLLPAPPERPASAPR